MITIVIDPGHGGNERSNRGRAGYVEADGVLKISKYLKEELESTGSFNVILTRDRDITMMLTERAKIAIRNKADMFISEHTNAGPAEAGGAEAIHSVDIPGDKELAASFSKAIAEALGIKNRGAKTRASKRHPDEDYYTVIDTAQDGGVPHVFIIESAFHSNPAEEQLLLNDDNLRKIARAQAGVICDFYDVSHKGKETPTPTKPQELPKPKCDTNILQLQRTLNMLHMTDYRGRSLSEDGMNGPATRSAVKKLQEVCGLQVDGCAGPATWGAINQILSRQLTKRGSKGVAVRYVQWRVGTSIDGIFGQATEKAVRAWQRVNGLTVDGCVGPRTWKALIG